jgi:hypothetical protein
MADAQAASSSAGTAGHGSGTKGSSRWEVTVLSATYQSIESPLLSTLYEPLLKHLISVLVG